MSSIKEGQKNKGVRNSKFILKRYKKHTWTTRRRQKVTKPLTSI
jgi:hypothetical protein